SRSNYPAFPFAMDASEPPIALFNKRTSKSKSKLRKRPVTPPPARSDSDSEEYSSSDNGSGGRRVKRQRRNAGAVTTSSAVAKASKDALEATQFKADRSKTIESTNDATKQSNWFDEGSKDGSGSTGLRSNPVTEVKMNDTYKGAANYKSFIPKNPNAPSR